MVKDGAAIRHLDRARATRKVVPNRGSDFRTVHVSAITKEIDRKVSPAITDPPPLTPPLFKSRTQCL